MQIQDDKAADKNQDRECEEFTMIIDGRYRPEVAPVFHLMRCSNGSDAGVRDQCQCAF